MERPRYLDTTLIEQIGFNKTLILTTMMRMYGSTLHEQYSLGITPQTIITGPVDVASLPEELRLSLAPRALEMCGIMQLDIHPTADAILDMGEAGWLHQVKYKVGHLNRKGWVLVFDKLHEARILHRLINTPV